MLQAGQGIKGMSGTDTYKYRAFISYSHLDDKPAGTLFNRLEAYRLPPKARRETGHNGRLGTFFRDRDELRASGDLSEQIKSALAASEFLIVLCSPEAATSPWVNREILEFKRLHGEKNILAVILSGEPHGSGAGPDAECFPEALRFRLGENGALSDSAAEPLAADFRKNGDGKRLGFLKLAAALADVDLARLLERDQQRRQRRVTAVTLASSILMLAMSGLALFAFNAQQEAERQQAEAEGLIEFMLTDLRDALEPVGRLDVLSSVGDEIDGYYARQQEEALQLTDKSIAQRAINYHLLGDIDQRRGDLGSAEKRFFAAYQATLKLYQAKPNNADVIYNHAQSAFWAGYAPYLREDYETARKFFTEYAEFSQKLFDLHPFDHRALTELASSYSNLGTLFSVQKNFNSAEALVYFEKSLVTFEEILSENPRDLDTLLNIATVYSWTSDMISYERTLAEALEYRLKLSEIHDRIDVISPDSKRNLFGRLQNQAALAGLYRDTGRLDDAHSLVRKALAKSQTLIEADYTVLNSHLIYLLHCNLYAELLMLLNKDAFNAISSCKDSVAHLEARVASGEISATGRYNNRVVLTSITHCEILLNAGYTHEAKNESSKIITNLSRKQDQSDSIFQNRMLAKAYMIQAISLTDISRQESTSALLKATEVLSKPEQHNPRWLYVLYKSLVLLGEHEKATKISNSLNKSGFKDPRYISFLSTYTVKAGE